MIAKEQGLLECPTDYFIESTLKQQRTFYGFVSRKEDDLKKLTQDEKIYAYLKQTSWAKAER